MAINRDKVLLEAQKLVDKKRYDKAIAEYQKVVAEDPNDVRTLLKIGDLYLRIQQYAEAIATYDRVATYYSVQGFSVKAVAVYKQIREIIQKHAPHLEDRFGHVVPKLADLLTQLDLRSDALAYYDEMATRLQVVGRDRDAIDVFRKIVGLDSNNPVSHLRLADAYTRVRDFDSATQEFMVASEILLRIGRKDDALRVIDRITQYRQEPRFAKLAAEILLDRGQGNDSMSALTKLQAAFKANPRDLETLNLLARAFDGLGQPAKAVEVQKEAASIARETGQREAFDQIVAGLVQRAPNDERVRQLAALIGSDSRSSLPPSAYPSSAYPAAPARSIPATAPAGAQKPAQMKPPPPPPSAPERDDDVPISVVEEISVVDLVVDDMELESEIDSNEGEPFALRSSYPPAELAAGGNPVREILAKVEVLRRGADFDAAARVLRMGIIHNPLARDLRERLCDVLIEGGDQDSAVLEMLAFSRFMVEEEDPDGAARLLDEVLLLEPNNRVALDMLRALGYAVPQHEEEPAPPSQAQTAAPPNYDPMAPLPSYDLEELTADELPLGVPHPAGIQAAPAIRLDDPFASEVTMFGMDMPAYPLEDERTRLASQGVLDESALEEMEFFTANGMLEEAEGILSEQLARLPNHPLLLEKRREIEQLRLAQEGGVGARPHGRNEQSVTSFRAEPAGPQSAVGVPSQREVTVDRAYDIAHALDEMDNVLENFGPTAEPQALGQVSVEQVFEQFKAGIAAQIAESDADTHYDLGVAYKEMGLTDDAIHEFELASRDPTRECVCQSMIGMLHIQAGNLEAAIDAFLRGLTASRKTQDQEVALTYEIGNAYEMRNNPEQALYYFQLVARLDPSHRDPRGSVAERISNLERLTGQDKAPQKAAARAAAVGAGDEFDAAFDDLFNPKR